MTALINLLPSLHVPTVGSVRNNDELSDRRAASRRSKPTIGPRAGRATAHAVTAVDRCHAGRRVCRPSSVYDVRFRSSPFVFVRPFSAQLDAATKIDISASGYIAGAVCVTYGQRRIGCATAYQPCQLCLTLHR